MNTSIFYMTSSVLAIGGLWLLWQLGFRPLMLDNLRDDLFELRDRLYKLAQDGKIECRSEAYRTVELLLNGVIRYAHRFTFFSYIMSQVEVDQDPDKDEIVEFSMQVSRKIETVKDPEAQDELRSIIQRISTLIPRYAAKSSLLFLISAGLYFVILRFQPVFALAKKKEAVSAFERDAYLSSQFDSYVSA